MRAIAVGIQGSGKSTQFKELSRIFGIPHISTGDILRSMAKGDTPEATALRLSLDSGEMTSDEDMAELISARLSQDDTADGFLLDGFPRTADQARLLGHLSVGASVDVAIDIKVDKGTATQRLLNRGRSDDTAAAINRRIELYESASDGVISELKSQQIPVVTINGTASKKDVTAKILRAVALLSRLKQYV